MRLLVGAMRPRTVGAGFVFVAAALALVPLLLATLAFGHAFRASETARADTRLVTAARLALDRISAADAAALDAARSLAMSRHVQAALLRGEAGGLSTYVFRRGDVIAHLLAPGVRPPEPPGTITRTVSVTSSGETIGVVAARVPLAPRLASVAETTGTVVRVTRAPVTGPQGGPVDVRVHGERYRVLRERVAPGLAIEAVVPARAIDATVRHRQLVTLGAGALTVAALVLAGLLLRNVRGRKRHRSPVALVGDVVAAAHDPRALLPVLLETAVVALNAAGGRVVWDGEEIAAIGSQGSEHAIVMALDEGPSVGRRIVLNPPRGGFSAADREVARALVAQSRIALENAHLHSVVRRQAVTDELTDLANRRRFMEVLQHEVARAARFDTSLALVLFDLDHFKRINDRYGHQVGDEVLRATAEVIRGRVRETDLPARIGGEEFAVILTGTDLAGAVALAEHLRHDLSEYVRVLGADWTVTASFGVAVPGEGESAEVLIGAADRALYRAKAEGRNVVRAAETETSSAA